MSNPYDYINSVNFGKTNIIRDGEAEEKSYNAYITNRQLSYFVDAIMYSNDMNQYHELDQIIQYEYYLNALTKKKRFSKWSKPEVVEDIQTISDYYGYSKEKARSALKLHSKEQIEKMRDILAVE